MLERRIKIAGTGKYLPKRKVTAAELGEKIGATTEWIMKKSGVAERYFADGETAAQMGARAALEALNAANLTLQDIDLVVSSSGVMQQPIPSTASLIQKELGMQNSGIPAFDINSTCLGFITAVDILSYLIQAGRHKRILVVCSDIASVGLNWQCHESCTIFGDGAAAAVLTEPEASDASRLLSSRLETYCEGADYCRILGGGSFLHARHKTEGREDPRYLFEMDGQATFRMASQKILDFIDKLLNPLKLSECALFIPHQASLMAMRIMQKKLALPNEKMMVIAEKYGNMISASLPLAFHEAIAEKRIKRGDHVVLLGTSAGFSMGGLSLVY